MKRFWSKVEIASPTECWEWKASRKSHSYGLFHMGKKGSSMKQAHRVAYELTRGPIPEGLELDHLCRNRGCVNPFHMEAVTHHENVLRGALVKTHCLRGHERTPESVYANGNCKECYR